MTGPPEARELRRLVDLSDHLLVVADGTGALQWVNQALGRRVGLGPDALGGTPLAELFHPADRAGFDPVPTGDDTEVGARLKAPEGQWWPVRWRLRWDPQRGRLYGAGRVGGPATDAQAARPGRQAAVRAVIERNPSTISVQDPGGRLLLVNDEWRRVHGEGREVIGTVRPLPCAVPGPEGGPTVTDEEIDTVDGSCSYLLTRFWLRDREARPTALAELGTDITDRRRAEQEAERRQRQLDAMLTTSADIIGILDAAGRTRLVNPAEADLLGYHHENPTEVDMAALVHPDDRDRVVAAFAALLAGRRQQVEVRYRLRTRAGREATVDSRARPLLDQDATVTGAVVVTREVTAQLEAEVRLRRALGAAEQALRTKSEFLSRTSHELRTPLNAVLGFAQLLELDDLTDAQRAAVGHVLRAGQHLLELIDEVLDIARIETGHLALRSEDVALGEVVAEAVAGVRPLAAGAEVTVSVGDCGGLSARGDRDRIAQVLRTVILDAVGRDGPGGGVVVAAHAPRPHTVRLTVSGTRASSGTAFAAEAAGSGLGLCVHLVALMGGELRSVAGESGPARVELDLPSSDTPDPDVRVRILLVEADLGSLPLVERLAQRRPGTVVLAAMQGRLAVDLARQHRPALVLAEDELPDMSAAELAGRLAADPATAGSRVVVLGDAAGGAERLARPIDVRGLLALVDEIRAQMARERPSQ